MNFDSFFRTVTGLLPYDYQRELALRPDLPEMLSVPTGAGKTLAVLMAWLWRRRFSPDFRIRQETPRRLIYCLPARVLVTQTAQIARDCASRLKGLSQDGDGNQADVDVYVTMGGEMDDAWASTPERDAILIGTQDMLLSRALNRGYGASRFRWPALFGLVHSDSLWVFDEIQLMGEGLYTSAQMDAFRKEFGVYGKSRSIWMSATACPDWLRTINRTAPAPESVLSLSVHDVEGGLSKRLNARKVLRRAEVSALPAKRYVKEVANEVLNHHQKGSLTLVIANTVDRAIGIHEAIAKSKPRAELLLIHSRFRPAERDSLERTLKDETDDKGPGRIVVSTQVVEAGVDLSARTLVTELAPWSSLVQRWGRTNRGGEHDEATVIWVDLPDDTCMPYSAEEMDKARGILNTLEGQSVSPSALPTVGMEYGPQYAFRKRDFNELFDTTPDITGADIDVSRFVRGQDNPDVRVFWRDWKTQAPPNDMPGPHRREMCQVPVTEIRRLMNESPGRRVIWRWDHIDGNWIRAEPRDVYPGQVFLLYSAGGGYSTSVGWAPASTEPVEDMRIEKRAGLNSSNDRKHDYARDWVSLNDHSRHVADALTSIARQLGAVLSKDMRESLDVAARWHDVGKAHDVFQNAMLHSLSGADRLQKKAITWAKRPYEKQCAEYERRGFRHELASALMVLAHLHNPLIAYLVASHHGRIRGAIRSLPGEKAPNNGRPYARGVVDGDRVPEIRLNTVHVPETVLSLDCMELGTSPDGNASWVDQVDRLLSREDLGPFRLAYLESLLIAADWTASAKEGGESDHGDSKDIR